MTLASTQRRHGVALDELRSPSINDLPAACVLLYCCATLC
jgi:hypothetical protein